MGDEAPLAFQESRAIVIVGPNSTRVWCGSQPRAKYPRQPTGCREREGATSHSAVLLTVEGRAQKEGEANTLEVGRIVKRMQGFPAFRPTNEAERLSTRPRRDGQSHKPTVSARADSNAVSASYPIRCASLHSSECAYRLSVSHSLCAAGASFFVSGSPVSDHGAEPPDRSRGPVLTSPGHLRKTRPACPACHSGPHPQDGWLPR